MPFRKTKLQGDFLGTLVKWTAIALVVVLVAFNIGNLLLYRELEPLLSRQMGERQAFTAKTIAQGLRPSRIRSFEADPEGIYGRLLSEHLDELRDAGEFASITLLDTSGTVLYSSGGGYKRGEYFHYLAIDRAAFNSALAGIPAFTELYESGGSYIRGAYSPVFDELGGIAWVLGIEAGAEYHGALTALKRNLLLFFILSVIVALAAGGILISAAIELSRMERQLIQASALSSIGEMTAGMAHEVRNPLAIIRGSAERIRAAKSDDSEQLVGFITDEVARINDILEGYLSLARPATDKAGPILIGEIAEDVAKRVAKRAEKSGVEISVESGDELSVVASESAIRRALLNLYLNAIEAMPNGGKITVTTERKAEKQLELTVSDNGHGIGKRAMKHIFDAFVSSKPGGTGLGLTLCKTIIEEAGGKITVESKPGVGTTFRITLPTAEPQNGAKIA